MDIQHMPTKFFGGTETYIHSLDGSPPYRTTAAKCLHLSGQFAQIGNRHGLTGLCQFLKPKFRHDFQHLGYIAPFQTRQAFADCGDCLTMIHRACSPSFAMKIG
jgi:hypothetical protein